jgi:hypothetical protein
MKEGHYTMQIKWIACSFSVGFAVKNFVCSLNSTSFNLNCIGINRQFFISEKCNAWWTTKTNTSPVLVFSYAIAVVTIGTFLTEPSDLRNGDTHTVRSVWFTINTPFPTQHVLIAITITDMDFDATMWVADDSLDDTVAHDDLTVDMQQTVILLGTCNK